MDLEKNWTLYKHPHDENMHKNCLSSQSCHFVKNYIFTIKLLHANVLHVFIFTIKLLHANVLHVFIVKVKYQITTSKAVVGVDRPVSAHLIINVENLHKKLSKFTKLPFRQKLHFHNKTSSCECLTCLYCEGKVSDHYIKSCGRS